MAVLGRWLGSINLSRYLGGLVTAGYDALDLLLCPECDDVALAAVLGEPGGSGRSSATDQSADTAGGGTVGMKPPHRAKFLRELATLRATKPLPLELRLKTATD